MREKSVFTNKLTNGSADIEAHKVEQPFSKIRKQFKGLKSSEADKLMKIMEKSLKKIG